MYIYKDYPYNQIDKKNFSSIICKLLDKSISQSRIMRIFNLNDLNKHVRIKDTNKYLFCF